jgi:hypothetical protein
MRRGSRWGLRRGPLNFHGLDRVFPLLAEREGGRKKGLDKLVDRNKMKKEGLERREKVARRIM